MEKSISNILGSLLPCVSLILSVAFALEALAACSHRGDGELNVDRIQDYANSVEKSLRATRAALKKGDLDRAKDELEEAEEVLEDNRKEMEAYPELDELDDSVSRAKVDVCFGCVKIPLDKYFAYIHDKDPDEARDALQLARKEHVRCKDLISSRPEYLALKMNLDTAPESLENLMAGLARPALLKKIQQAQQPLDNRKKKIVNLLKKFQARPDRRDLAVKVYSLIEDLSKALESSEGVSGDLQWNKYKKQLRSDIASFSKRREALVRRGKVLIVVRKNLPSAEKRIKGSLKQRRKNKKKAILLLKEARAELVRCQDVLKIELTKDTSLKKYSFQYKGRKRNVTWLIRHLRARMGAVSAMLNPKRRHRIKRW